MIRMSLMIGVVMLFAAVAHAQRPDDRGRRPGGPPGRFPMPPGFHLMEAIDADKDGRVSTKEIENAAAALKKLDKNNDGKLSKEEIGWPPVGGFGGPPGGGFPGFGGGGFPGFGGNEGGKPQRPDPEGERVARARKAANRPSIFSPGRLQRLDRNKDGKITKEEIPRSLRDLVFGRADTNKDGVIDEQELGKFAEPKP